MEEKRKEQRVAAIWPTRLIRANRSVVNGKTRNITARGVQIESPHTLPEGEKVVIEMNSIHAGQKKLLRVVGQVTYTLMLSGSGQQGYGVGINFLSLSAEDREYIESYITTKLFEME
jgi:hypothetical protein